MTPLGSSSCSAESSMDNTSNTTVATTNTSKHKHRQRSTNPKAFNNKRKNSHPEMEEEEDAEVWATFNNNFRQVQSVLDRNRILIQQVNENHQSRIPDNMVKIVALIQEINGNISKVVSLYSDLSSDFTGVFHQRKNGTDSEREGGSA